MVKVNFFAKQKQKKENDMKELIIVFIILIIIIGGAIYTNNYLKNSSEQLIGQLEDLKQSARKNLETNGLKTQVEKLYNNWEQTEEKWALVVSHTELDLIETGFVRLKAQIEEEELERSIEEIDATIFLVNHISEKERFCLKNVF